MIVTEVKKVGQKFVDQPIYSVMRPKPVSTIAVSLALAFKRKVPEAIVDVIGYERIQLRWMKPDGKGGLVPR